MKKEMIIILIITLIACLPSLTAFIEGTDNNLASPNIIVEDHELTEDYTYQTFIDKETGEEFAVREKDLETGDSVMSKKTNFVPNDVVIKLKQDITIQNKNILKRSLSHSKSLLGMKYSLIETNNPRINKVLEKHKVKSFKKVFDKKNKKRGITGRVVGYLTGKVVDSFDEELDRVILIKTDDTLKTVKDIQNEAGIEYAEPNYLYELAFVPNDPLYPQQWEHQNTEAELGWDIERGSEKTIIAIIDTGISWNHEDLADNIWNNQDEIPDNGIDDDNNGYIDDVRGWDFTDTTRRSYCTNDCLIEDNDPNDEYGHGTHVAGTAAGVSNNNLGIAGVCHKCKIMPLRTAGLETTKVVNAIHYATDNGARIISMSFGGYGISQTLKDALDYAYENNLVLIAAAGNSNTNSIHYPSGYDNVIAVTATDSSDKKASFSNYGYWTDIAAPGVGISSTMDNSSMIAKALPNYKIANGYWKLSGTSMATPYVSGVAGLILSLHPDRNNVDIIKSIKLGIDLIITYEHIGSGRVNVLKALTTESKDCFAKINSPEINSIINNDVVEIEGIALCDDFVGYKLDYVESDNYIGEDTVWNNVHSSNTQKEGNLYNWDVKDIEDGEYIILLTVESEEFKTYSFTIINIQRTKINEPLSILNPIIKGSNYLYKPGETLSILGKSFGNNFEYYDIEVCNKNGNCNDENIELIDDGLIEKNNELLARYHIPNNINSGYYNIKLKNRYNSLDHYDVSRIYIETDFLEGWPRKLGEFGLFFDNQPTIADLNNDGYKEIIYAYKNKITIFNHNGTYFNNFPKKYPSDFYFTRAPAVKDLNNDNKKEMIVGDADGYVHVFDMNGNHLPGWPKLLGSDKSGYITFRGITGVIIEDINMDGKDEIIFGDKNEGKIHVVDIDGNELYNYPILAPINNQFPDYAGLSPIHSLVDRDPISVGDLDGNGYKEIVVVTKGFKDNNFENQAATISIFDYQGNILPGWPRYILNGSLTSDITLVDLNKDSYLDIVFTQSTRLQAIDMFGDEINSFPFEIDSISGYDFDDFELVGAIVGDLENDGIYDIFFGLSHKTANNLYDRLYGLEFNNNQLDIKEGFPISTGASCVGAPITSQVKGGYVLANLYSSENQILVIPIGMCLHSPNTAPWINIDYLPQLYAFNSDGEIADGFPKPINDFRAHSNTFSTGDLDNDGDNEIIAMDRETLIYVWDLEGDERLNKWSLTKHDLQRTGNYHFQQEDLKPLSTLTNNAQTPITGTLKLILQKYDLIGAWIDEQVVINQQKTLAPSETVDLGALWNSVNVSANSIGDYRIYASFESAGQKKEAVYEFRVE